MVVSAERQKLANAIEAQTLASQKLDEAKIALANARSRWSAANQKVSALEAEIEEAERANTSDKFIETLAGDLDVVVETPVAELRKKLDAAQAEAAVWRHAIKTAEGAVADRKEALDWSAGRVDVAARSVTAAEVNYAALLSATEGLRNELLDAQSRLAAIASAMDHQSDARRTIDNFLTDGWLLYSPWRDRAAAEPIKDAFAALKTDASASLKI